MANARSSAYQPAGDDSTGNNARVPQDRPRTLRIETLARSGPNSQRHHECESGRHSAHHTEPQSDPGPVTPLGPLSSLERRPTGTGLTLNSYYDPIRGENVLCSFVSSSLGSGHGLPSLFTFMRSAPLSYGPAPPSEAPCTFRDTIIEITIPPQIVYVPHQLPCYIVTPCAFFHTSITLMVLPARQKFDHW